MYRTLIGERCRRSGGGGLRDWRVLSGRCQALGGGGGGGGQGGRCRNERWVPAAAGGVFPALKSREDGQKPQGGGAGAGGSPLGPGLAPGPGSGRGGEGGFPPGGGAGLASQAEAPGRGRSTPRPLRARWAGGRRFRGLARGSGTRGGPGTPSARWPTRVSATRPGDVAWVCSEEAVDVLCACSVFGDPLAL